MPADPRTSVVVLTHDRVGELRRTLQALEALPERPPLVVVDNASSDGSAERVAVEFPRVEVVRSERNLGAAGRNLGVERVRTRYVAFCDDDTWWKPGALRLAADALDAHPSLGAIAARVLVGPEERLDPTCVQMRSSPLDRRGLPGPALIGFMAGAVVMRADAYRQAGGYEERFFLGAEESLLGFDLAARGWAMVYLDDVVACHHPSRARDASLRSALHARNLLWLAWLRLPWRSAWRETVAVLHPRAAPLRAGGPLWLALSGLPWVLRERRVLPEEVHRGYLAVKHHVRAAAGAAIEAGDAPAPATRLRR